MDWDFIANGNVDVIDIVPDQYKGYYEEDKANNRYVLKADIKPLAEAFTGANKKLVTLNKQKGDDNRKDQARRTIIEGITAKLTEAGIEVGEDIATLPDVISTKLTELMDTVKGGKEVKTNLEAIKKDFDKRLQAELAKKDGELTSMRGSLERYMVNSAAMSALAGANTADKGADLLMPIIQKSTRVIKSDDGEYTVSIVDSDNNVRLNNKGEAMTIADLVAEMKTTYPIAFKSEQKGGGGAPNAQARTTPARPGAPRPGAVTERSATQKIAAGLANLGRR